jgi:hypothetical protein
VSTSGTDIKALERQVAALEAKLNEILYILKGTPAKKAQKVVIPAGEVVTVVSDIKKAPAKKVATKKEAAPKVAKKVAVKKVVVKKVIKKVAKKK